ncbi:pyrimidine reductase family protein [Naumannella sp. ID2617S]|nr:pyrimidine reductase family protein [Naumannella sp. ID2617S]
MDELVTGQRLSDTLDAYRGVDRSRPQGEAWVMGHMVAGLDGTAAINGRVGELSSSPDKDLFLRMRELGDVVLVGAETVRREGYGPVRLSEDARARRTRAGKPPTPPVAVVSGSLNLDWESRIFAEPKAYARTMIVTCRGADPERVREAEAVAEVVYAGDERVDPRRAVAALADLGHRVIVCEGGPTWLGELAAADRLDELCLSIAPLMGGDPLPVAITPAGAGVTNFVLRTVLADSGTLFLRYEAEGPDR